MVLATVAHCQTSKMDRLQTNIQKGAFAQSLAQTVISDGHAIAVPEYIVKALQFIMAE